MGHAARTTSSPAIDSQHLQRLETHFISPEIYGRDDVAVRQAKLARVVSSEIIPRLLRLNSQIAPLAQPIEQQAILIPPGGNDLEAAAAYVLVLRERGLPMNTLFIELLEPTARHLGEMWNRDECDFIDVTLGVARLQKLLAVFNDTHGIPALDTRRHVLMAMTPGDQHYFGVTMVERFLLAAGWQVQTELSATSEEIADAARNRWFAVVGLTAGSERQLDVLRSTIALVRKQSLNPAIGVMVGGPMFTANPALADDVGADATAPNAPAAVLVAQKLFDIAADTFRNKGAMA
jgi:MerR family transcriptional regulator, light-induced transcriptional regulator